jgi:large subunit ribosomal protein L25
LLRGEAPGEKEGGVVAHVVHYVEIETSPIAIPEALHININHLALNQSLTLAAITDLPAGATLVTDPETVAVQCEEPAPEVEEEALAGGAEPEIIGRKAAEEEEGEEK